ncbi:hypothetical protein V1512DRAFT_263155 [Lipomyces arxii]|uniref:uncharacterized protein n=1 Tax=Lipomyces arxii TaxID=56418 RepID=UPI0034CEDB44
MSKRKSSSSELPNKKQKKNTAIYITNLSPEITFDELNSVVSKYGLVAEDLSTSKPRIKLYQNEDGSLKGDALVVYFREESVQLAIDMLDETELHDKVIKVQPADLNYKVEKEPQPIKQRTSREKNEILKSVNRLNSKLADWDDDDIPATNPKYNNIVILKNAFTLDELQHDVTAELDIKQDIREGCEEIGPVTNVVLYDLEPDGIISVRFQHQQDALECVRQMDGRFFDGKRLEAGLYDGTRYRKSHKEQDDQSRLDQFGEWLEQE